MLDLKKLSLLLAAVMLAGCLDLGTDDDDEDEVDDGGDIDGGGDPDPEMIDITDVNFTNRAPECTDYVGEYFSEVMDEKRGLDFEGEVEISESGTNCLFETNGIPNHDFNDSSAAFATDVSEQNNNYSISASPAMANNSTPLALGTTEIVMLNGAVLDILPAACYGEGNEQLGREKIGCGQDKIDHPWRYDPMSSLNSFGTDANNAHTQPDGTYHYHGNPKAMFSDDCSNQTNASPVIGFAADGYPVYGTCIEDPQTGNIRAATSSYQLKGNGGPRQNVSGYTTPVGGTGEVASNNYDGQFRGDWEYVDGLGDLDECNGMMVDGNYGYYVVNAFPWVINCFKGTVDSSFTGKEGVRSHSHERKW